MLQTLILLLFWNICSAQSRQLSYYFGHNDAIIFDSKEDLQGNIVSVGYLKTEESYNIERSFILKTTKTGEVIWCRMSIDMGNSFNFQKLTIAKNGDYLISFQPYYNVFRVDTAGNLKWGWRYVFSGNTTSDISMAELDNGDIAIAGSAYLNDVGNLHLYHGFIILADSNGYKKWVKSYGYTENTAHHEYMFNDMVAKDDMLYVAGCRNPQDSKTDGMFWVIDTTGVVRRFDQIEHTIGYQYDSIQGSIVFNKIAVFNDRIYLSGYIENNLGGQPEYSRRHIIGVIDTVANKFDAQLISAGGHDELSNSTAFIADSNTYYISGNPKNAVVEPKNRLFISKFQGGAELYTKRLKTDSLLSVNNISVYGDTVQFSGSLGTSPKAFFGYFNESNVLSDAINCDIQDTVISIDTFSRSLTLPYTYDVVDQYVSQYGFFTIDTFTCYKMVLCDDSYPNLVKYHEAEESISVYPNPASTLVYINNNTNRNVSMDIVDICGKLVRSEQISTGKRSVDISDLPKGVYILRSKQVNSLFVQKLTIQ